VYPTLQLLEDKGFVRGEDVDGRRVFSLTGDGREELEKARRKGHDPLGALDAAASDPRLKLRHAVHSLGGAAHQVASSGSPTQIDEATAILTEARKRIYTLLAEGE